MENQKNNKGVIVLLIVIIVILVTLCVLFATGTISFNSNKANDSEVNENINGSDQTNEDNNIETNTSGNNDVFKTLVGTYKKTTHSDCGESETTLTIRNNGTADLYMNTCVGESSAKNAIFSINEKQIYIIDKTCEMVSSGDGGSCTIGGGCYSGGCSPLWTFDYTIDGSNVTIEGLIKQ